MGNATRFVIIGDALMISETAYLIQVEQILLIRNKENFL